MPKPIIAAMHGTPLGGGLELALGCHFRIAAPGTRLGLPEIKLGLMPGAGGTQRLPRLVGVEKALGMILRGDPIPAKDALASGLVDEIVEGDLLQAPSRSPAASSPKSGRCAACAIATTSSSRSGTIRLPTTQLVAKHAKRGRNLAAPAAAIEVVRGSFALPIEEGLKRERAAFMELVSSDQSKAQRHVFFAEREAAKVPGMPAGTKPREVARVGVIGAGTMGGGIAMCFANAGIPVTIVEENQAALDRGLDTIAKNYRTSVQRGGLTQEEMDRRMGLLKGVTIPRRRGRRRHGDRGSVRGNGRQEEGLRRTRPHHQEGRGARHQHLLSRRQRDRRRLRSVHRRCSACTSSARRT